MCCPISSPARWSFQGKNPKGDKLVNFFQQIMLGALAACAFVSAAYAEERAPGKSNLIGALASGSSPIRLETGTVEHKKTPNECAAAAKAAFKDNHYTDLIREGVDGTYAGDQGKIFVIRCDAAGLAILAGSFYPWPQVGDVNTETVYRALEKHLK
jgi:hypothetical protein